MDKLDILNREEFVEKLFNLTQQLSFTKKNATFAIDGSWGVGKSFVLDMYEEKLSQEQSEETNKDRYFVIRYNCWKYDYYEEPLIAIVSAMIETIEQKTKLFSDNEKKSKILGGLKAVGLSLLSMANSAIREKTRIDLKKAYNVVKDGVDEGAKEYEEKHDYDVYFGFNKAMNALQQSLSKLSNDYTVIFMVDELDRCLPEYAIKVLERLHHLTEEAQNTITVVAIDKTQLVQSIKNTFGFDECDKYLKKFIEFEIKLDKGMVSEQFAEKYSYYVDLFDKNTIEYDDAIEEFFQAIFQDIDARKQEQLINRATIIHKLLFNDKKDYSFMCVELLSLIASSCYENTRVLCTEMGAFCPGSTLGTKKELPPFASFFDEKIKNMFSDYRPGLKNIRAECLSSPATKNLYVDVTYTWHRLYLENKYTCISLKSNEKLAKLNENVVDLKKFIDASKLIK